MPDKRPFAKTGARLRWIRLNILKCKQKHLAEVLGISRWKYYMVETGQWDAKWTMMAQIRELARRAAPTLWRDEMIFEDV